MTLRNMIEQGVILQGNIDITIFGEDDLTITSNYENCDKLSLNQIAKRHRDLENQQEYFRIDMKNIEQSNYEDNAINALLYMKKLKTEIAELELVMQLKKTNGL